MNAPTLASIVVRIAWSAAARRAGSAAVTLDRSVRNRSDASSESSSASRRRGTRTPFDPAAVQWISHRRAGCQSSESRVFLHVRSPVAPAGNRRREWFYRWHAEWRARFAPETPGSTSGCGGHGRDGTRRSAGRRLLQTGAGKIHTREHRIRVSCFATAPVFPIGRTCLWADQYLNTERAGEVFR